MKKLSVLALAVCTLSVAVPATAGTAKYKGDIDPSGRLAFSVEKAAGKVKVDKLNWSVLPVDCNGTPGTTSGGLSFRVPVKQGSFHAAAVLGDPDNPEAKADIRGKLTAKAASGTISVSGTKTPLDTGKDSNCRSGSLDWTASR